MAILCMYITYVCMSPVLFNLAGYLLNATAVVIIWVVSSNDSFLFQVIFWIIGSFSLEVI